MNEIANTSLLAVGSMHLRLNLNFFVRLTLTFSKCLFGCLIYVFTS